MIHPLMFRIGQTTDDFPQLYFHHQGMAITDPYLSDCGRFEVANPEAEYGIPIKLARAIANFNECLAEMHKQAIKHYVPLLAKQFSTQLHEHLGEDAMRQVVERNEQDCNPNVCHSHDFCDANVLMALALQKVGLIESPDDFEINLVTPYWNDAWNLAKQKQFKF